MLLSRGQCFIQIYARVEDIKTNSHLTRKQFVLNISRSAWTVLLSFSLLVHGVKPLPHSRRCMNLKHFQIKADNKTFGFFFLFFFKTLDLYEERLLTSVRDGTEKATNDFKAVNDAERKKRGGGQMCAGEQLTD